MLKALKLLSSLSCTATVLAYAPLSHAVGCSDLSLKGAYGYTVTGTIINNVGPLVVGPFAAVGRIVFDGAGHVNTIRSLSDDGFVQQADAGTGTYVLASDCTGTFNITVGPPGNTLILNLNIVLDDTFQIRGLVTNTGTVLVFEGRRQFPY